MKSIIPYLCLMVLCGCAHGGAKSNSGSSAGAAPINVATTGSAAAAIVAPTVGWMPSPLREAVVLRLKGDVKSPERTKYCAGSSVKTFAGADLRNEKNEATEFTVETRVSNIDAANDRISQTLRLIKKEGPMDLRDFAMPDADEKLELVITGRGRVLRAGNYPKNSLYYVPAVSLPEHAVGKGDTWTLAAQWSPIGEDTVLQLEMLSILKEFWTCGSDVCAEIEITGEVQAGAGKQRIAGYKNEWRGRMLFDATSGVVIWSRLDSEEIYEGERGKRVVHSTLDGWLLEPSALAQPIRAAMPTRSCVVL